MKKDRDTEEGNGKEEEQAKDMGKSRHHVEDIVVEQAWTLTGVTARREQGGRTDKSNSGVFDANEHDGKCKGTGTALYASKSKSRDKDKGHRHGTRAHEQGQR